MKPHAAAVMLCAVIILGQVPAAYAIPLGDFAKLDRQTRAKMLGDVLNKLAIGIADGLSAPLDSRTRQPKSPERLASGKKRAALVKEIALKPDTTEIAARIHLATSVDPAIELESVLTRYITDEVKKREEEVKRKEKK